MPLLSLSAPAPPSRVSLPAPPERVVAGAALHAVVERIAGPGEVARPGVDHRLERTGKPVGCERGLHLVDAVAGKLQDGVAGVVHDEGVVASSADHGIAAGAAVYGVVALSAQQAIVPVSAENKVVAAAPDNGIGAVQTLDDVISIGAAEEVRARVPSMDFPVNAD